MAGIDLSAHGITVKNVIRNAPPAELYKIAMQYEAGTTIASNGAMVAYSAEKTGRSPKDKRIIKNSESEKDVWWGPVNVARSPASFAANLQRAKDFLNNRERLYVVDGFAGWDPKYRIKVRIICARAYHALFMWDMLIRPSAEEAASFGKPDAVVYNAGQFPADPFNTETKSRTCVDLNLDTKEASILGTQYAGEMKKGIFTLMNYLMPKSGVLSMHCSATACPKTGKSSLLFGLSGTGKTTLSADPNRLLIGDDEHCWTKDGIFNIEGGCYAKMINLSPEGEPDIYRAMKFGAIMENVVLNDRNDVDYADGSITENTRGAYPIEFIPNAKVPCVASHPTDILFLTCDAFGVLPPVARLSPEQAMYHFIGGYTAKVAGTEMGVTEPQATFSPCFGGPFLVWHPVKYAEMLAEKLKEHNSRVWLVNTGWSGGSYGVGQRMKLSITRKLVDAIHNGSLADAPTEVDPIFGFSTVTKCEGVPADALIPRNSWKDKAKFDETAKKLAAMFIKNFEKYASAASPAVKSGGPRVSPSELPEVTVRDEA
jgi:phosphoenolpyruvate carboxykinase (ATP)